MYVCNTTYTHTHIILKIVLHLKVYPVHENLNVKFCYEDFHRNFITQKFHHNDVVFHHMLCNIPSTGFANNLF